MKIWIDFTNSPHVNFFEPFIHQWTLQGHDLLITCKDHGNIIDLIELKGWKYTVLDKYGGKSKLKKIIFWVKRLYSLQKFLSMERPRIGIGQSTFGAPVAAKIRGIPFIYLNDNEHALAGNYIAMSFSTISILPIFLKDIAKKRKWEKYFNISYYPSTKESIYLSQIFKHFKKLNSKNEIHNIYFRPEPWTALYYKGKKNFLDNLLTDLSNKYKIFILPRYKEQLNHFLNLQNNNLTVLIKPVSLKTIVENCDLFIGAGGTMTREIAILGIPTISTYQDELLEVDKYLIRRGVMFHTIELDKNYIENVIQKNNDSSKVDLMTMGNEAFEYINLKMFELIKT
ncbi:hypothetical protein AYK24_03315 [Thermoplasmatales archaeon SG8-52-4]|nr:MAG: hypothetical protein AYK24_03315 [Thermoplasmatales archaeon SG8-52-4]